MDYAYEALMGTQEGGREGGRREGGREGEWENHQMPPAVDFPQVPLVDIIITLTCRAITH